MSGSAQPAMLRNRPLALLCIPVTAALAVLLLMLRGPSCGHDFDFHLLSWMEVARDWHRGLADPHWIASANYGAGEPRLIFYPPASWFLGALLGSVAGWTRAPALFTFACLLGCGATMYRLGRVWLPRNPSVAAACLYATNPYTLFVAYERTAYGELLAAALLPLPLLFATRRRPPVAWLSLAVAAIWLANAPAGVIVCYALLWLAVARAVAERSLAPALRMGAAAALGLALDGFYLVPAAFEQRWVEIARAATAPGMRIRDSFLFAHTGEPFHDQVLYTASSLAVLTLAIATAAFCLQPAPLRKRQALLATLLPLCAFLLLPVSGFVWEHAPHLRFLQFPWRWLMIGSALAALFGGSALFRIPRRFWPGVVAAVLVLVSVTLCATRFYQVCDEEDNVAAQRVLFARGTGIEGTDEYTPAGADNSAVQQRLPAVRIVDAYDADEPDGSAGDNPEWEPDPTARVRAESSVVRWEPEQKTITVQASAPSFAVLRLMDYPAWRVTVNGAPVYDRPHREDGLLTVALRPGRSTIDVGWATTPDVREGRWISLLALVIWCVLVAARAVSARRRVQPA